MKRTWTDSDIEKFKKLYPVTSSKDLVKIFGRSAAAINSKAKYLSLMKDSEFFKKKQFTPEEIGYLIENYPHIRTDKIGKKFDRTTRSIYGKARCMGLKKSAEFMASPDAGNFQKGCTIGKEFWYKKGDVSANKGKKMSAEMREKCKHTFFQKGSIPSNTKKDGEIVLRHNKKKKAYYWIRISQDNWELLHRVLWEKENGDIPKGYNVVFKDGNQMNCEVSNLKLISKAELMLKNTIQRYPPELQKSIRLINKIEKYETD